jgi:ABC-type glycerol-3-phosphate transport system permease component
MLATVTITSLIATWNDLIWPLVTISDRKWMPLAQGLVQFSASFETDWGPLFAGYVIASLPLLVIFIVAMKQFISGITSGAIKA